MNIEIPVWPYVYGSPSGTGKIRCLPEDFIVQENLAFEPSGTGEHCFLLIQKTGENTEFVARQLAKFAGVRQRDIGYAGLKDRHAVTSQWFSVWLPGKAGPDWKCFETDHVKVLDANRHVRKLKRGVLSGNRFKITIRDWQGDQLRTIEQLNSIQAHGIANYYGEQRFGMQGHNVKNALAFFAGLKARRDQRSHYLSAARSFLFNQILGRRVLEKTWNLAIPGDVLMFDRSKSFFKAQFPDEEIFRRLEEKSIHSTGVLWGLGEDDVTAGTLALEQSIIASNSDLADGLVANKVEKSRRALRVNVENLEWRFIDKSALQLNFTLPAGSYATSLLREIVDARTVTDV